MAGKVQDLQTSDDRAADYLVELIGCAISDRKPPPIPAGCSWDEVLLHAWNNSVTGLIGYALRDMDGVSTKIRDTCDRAAEVTALRSIRYEAERNVLFSALREAGISYLPLKGACLVSRYPSYGMRLLGDNDILVGLVEKDASGTYYDVLADADERIRLRADEKLNVVMRDLGYEPRGGSNPCHAVFTKSPGLVFEMHRALFEEGTALGTYYRNPWKYAKAVSTVGCARDGVHGVAAGEFYLSVEDEFVYLLAHAYKHAQYKGLGIRVLGDIIVTAAQFDESTDRAYIAKQFSLLRMAPFARDLCDLARAVREGLPLSDEQRRATRHMIACGTYGNNAEAMRIRMRGYAAAGCRLPRFAELRRFFSLDSVADRDGFVLFKKFVLLRPFFPIVRIGLLIKEGVREPRLFREKLSGFIGGR